MWTNHNQPTMKRKYNCIQFSNEEMENPHIGSPDDEQPPNDIWSWPASEEDIDDNGNAIHFQPTREEMRKLNDYLNGDAPESTIIEAQLKKVNRLRDSDNIDFLKCNLADYYETEMDRSHID